jgi:hypothetical protein
VRNDVTKSGKPGLWELVGRFLFGARDPEPALDETLEDAQQLLIYAAEHGIAIDADVASTIITAARAGNVAWNGPDAGKLLAAIAAVSAKVSPVTAKSIADCRTIGHREIRIYTWLASMLAVIIIVLSIATSITSGLSNSITTDIGTANDLAVGLHTQLDTTSDPSAPQSHVTSAPNAPAQLSEQAPPGALSQLQQFAATIRAIKGETDRLNWFLAWGQYHDLDQPQTPVVARSPAPNQYELSPYLSNTLVALSNEANSKTALYQQVRANAKEVQGAIALWYAAVGTILLPVLYALLGACAYLLRLFSKEIANGSFSNMYTISARFFVALIGGIVVGLFGNWSNGISLSPLAFAFLVGYSADVFFAFLENSAKGLKSADH